MNSLSLLSSRVEKVIGASPPPTPRTESFKRPRHEHQSIGLTSGERPYLSRRGIDEAVFSEDEDGGEDEDDDDDEDEGDDDENEDEEDDEDQDEVTRHTELLYSKRTHTLGERIYIALLSPWLGAFWWIISTLAASADWFLSCVYDEHGHFSPWMLIRKTATLAVRPFSEIQDSTSNLSPSIKSQYWASPPTTPSLSDRKRTQNDPSDLAATPAPSSQRSRSKSFSHGSNPLLTEEIVPQRSIRIRLYNEDSVAKSRSSSVKSPTSPSSSLRLTKYPRNSGPPKPLLPSHPSPKTLILDLDETLIHSLAKGGRMTSGHMVEVKLDRQHAILYYVHKRPHCDDFLRKVTSKSTGSHV